MQSNNFYKDLYLPQKSLQQEQKVDEAVQVNISMDIIKELIDIKGKFEHRWEDLSEVRSLMHQVSKKYSQDDYYSPNVKSIYEEHMSKYKNAFRTGDDLYKKMSKLEEDYKTLEEARKTLYEDFLECKGLYVTFDQYCKELLIEKDKLYDLMIKRDADALSFFGLSHEDL